MMWQISKNGEKYKDQLFFGVGQESKNKSGKAKCSEEKQPTLPV